MKLLAFETSGKTMGIAVTDENGLLGEINIISQKAHSQNLMPHFLRLMNDLSLKLPDIDVVAVSKGPGSFTGIRVGLAFAKALSYTLEKDIITVNTLDAMAASCTAGDNDIVCPLIDARNNQVYYSVYKIKDNFPERLADYRADRIEDLKEIISKVQGSKNIIFKGDGAVLHRERLTLEYGCKCIFPLKSEILPKASNIADLAYILYNAGARDDPFSCEAFYLRPPQAEQKISL